jgi:hypothetical protein
MLFLSLHLVDLVELGNHIQPHFGEFVLQELQESWQQVLDGGGLRRSRRAAR